MPTKEEMENDLQIVQEKKYMSKANKETIDKYIEVIKEHATTNENKQIKIFDTTAENPKISENKKIIQKYKPKIVNIINKYVEYFVDNSDDEEIDENMDVNDVEKILDDKVKSYNKYNENHPMFGVTWNNAKKCYTVRHNEINTNTKKIDIACKKIMIDFSHNIDGKNLENPLKIKFIYSKQYFMTYWNEGLPFFDIQHILSSLKVAQCTAQEKYSKNKKNIEYYVWHQNEFGGYVLRELISESTMYKILLGSNSKISKKFKNDVANILVELRKDGQLKATNKKITLRKNDQPITIFFFHKK